MNKENTDEKAILQSHFENKILKSARYKTKYPNKTGSYDEKEQKYFIASFYKDANITEDDAFKKLSLKTPKPRQQGQVPLTFATCFSKNNNGNFIEKPFYEQGCNNDTYAAYGIIYDNFHTAVWSKRNNSNDWIIEFFENLPKHKCNKNIIDLLQNNQLPTSIDELCQRGIKRKDIQKLIELLKNNNIDNFVDGYFGESVYPGENGIEEYLSKLDSLRYRIGLDLGNENTNLPQANSKRKIKVGKDKNRYNFLMYDKKNTDVANIGYTDNKQYDGGVVVEGSIRHPANKIYHSVMTYDKAKKEILYNTVCNEFVSREQQEKVASLVVFMEKFTGNNFTKDTLHEFFQSCSCHGEGEANIPKLYKMIFAQKDLGIPYMPILGGDGKVLCVKLSKLLSIMKDDGFYKEYIQCKSPEKIKNEIQIKQTELNKIQTEQQLKGDNKHINEKLKEINKELKKLQLGLIEEITDDTIKEMEKFEEEKILELQKQANEQNNIETKEQQKEDIIEKKPSTSRLNEENIPNNNTGRNNSFYDTSQQWWQKFYSCSCCDDTHDNNNEMQINNLNNTNKTNINLN